MTLPAAVTARLAVLARCYLVHFIGVAVAILSLHRCHDIVACCGYVAAALLLIDAVELLAFSIDVVISHRRHHLNELFIADGGTRLPWSYKVLVFSS